MDCTTDYFTNIDLARAFNMVDVGSNYRATIDMQVLLFAGSWYADPIFGIIILLGFTLYPLIFVYWCLLRKWYSNKISIYIGVLFWIVTILTFIIIDIHITMMKSCQFYGFIRCRPH